ncbi:MAG: amino acid-binding protein [Methanobrevibacter sp.]|uniref:amino acid-binding protein n=1 Tax=Methanobrevibacter sp. TaxID=66852 RepID=UPI0025F47023|nr:amino acid-binding protein [Methanobrevibacter sp.]MBR0270409.1 amino acid-binding protein [Methanobrevibacter sp.]
MRMNLVLELLDVPGQLVSVLEPISGLGANLVTVIHKRDAKNENGKIPVQLTLEGEQDSLNRVIQRFDDLNISIIEKDGVINKELVSTILIGHIVDRDVRDTTDRINALDGVYVVGFDIKLDGEKKSTALINLEVAYGKKQYAFDEIEKISEEKELLMINEV